jgi:chorismate dehydratase
MTDATRDALGTLRVGRLPYLNALPFHAGFGASGPRWVKAPPRRLGELAARGLLDAALLASRDALLLEDEGALRPLGELGIACRGPVQSVLLFSRLPVESLSGRRIALTGESRTSRALLRILLARRHGLRHLRYVGGCEPADACLAIGDAALALRAAHAWPWTLDLGADWAGWTGLPFVYARWVVRRDAPEAAVAALRERLERSLDTPFDLGDAPLPPGLDPSSARKYLDRFVYRLGPEERAGLDRFRKEMHEHGLARRHS